MWIFLRFLTHFANMSSGRIVLFKFLTSNIGVYLCTGYNSTQYWTKTCLMCLLIYWFSSVENGKTIFWWLNWLLFCMHIFNEKLYCVFLSFFLAFDFVWVLQVMFSLQPSDMFVLGATYPLSLCPSVVHMASLLPTAVSWSMQRELWWNLEVLWWPEGMNVAWPWGAWRLLLSR